jgi:hypothetical protein
LIEELSLFFSMHHTTLKRHRELDGEVFAQSII